MPAATSGWARLGDALGGDSELEYEKGLNLGANTENALSQASERRTKAKAQMELAEQLKAANVDSARADAAVGALVSGGGLKDVGDMLHQEQEYNFRANAADPSVPFSVGNRQLMGVAAAPVERFGTAGDGMIQDKFSDAQPTVTPVGQALIGQREAAGNLSNEHAAHPEKFRFNGGTGDPDIDEALSKAVAEGRLDPSRLNSRTATIFGKLALGNPTLNFNRMIADAALQKNPTFQQRAMTMESLPEVMTTMTSLGRKVGFSDVRTIGKMQAWMKGELNDPDMQEYMTVRNDALMTIANVMRGVGMSDQAHRAEIEVASPSMSPQALDAWMSGQMASLQPRLSRVKHVTDLGNNPGAAPPPADAAPRAFNTAAEAEAAGLADGTRITIGGRSATWRN
jgi:hypothetical protein